MSRWSELSDEELDRRLADELRSMADEPRLGADWARLDLLPTVRAGLAERTGRPTSRLSPMYGVVGVLGIVGAVAVLAVVAVLMFARPPSTSGPVGTPPSSTVQSGDFTLTISADKARYTSGEPIGVMARLAYDGDGDKVTLSGSGMILAFSARQLDGELAMAGVRTADCAHHELRRDEPIERPFTKSGGWSRDDPNADFYDQWFRDPVFSLPAGRWEVMVTAEFVVGEGCAGEDVSMLASVVVTVGAPAPADPPATPPSTWSGLNTRDFAARLAAGDLRGQTVVVTGEIVREVVRAGGPCGLPTRNPCFFGELAGSDPPVVVFAAHRPALEGAGAIEADVDGLDWRWWEFPERPEGTASFVLFVSDTGLVEYVGLQSEEPMGVNSFGVVDPASWSQSDVAVVPGWLTAVGAGVGRLGAPPAPGTYIDGLPQRWSGSPAWLLDRPERFDPDGYFPPTDGVQVQNRAYEMFSGLRPTSRITEPVAGLWAVAPRLEGGGCPNDQPPCWRWNLIGRVTYQEPGPAMPVETPDATAAPQPTADPTPEPTVDPSAPGEHTCDPLYFTLVDRTGAVTSCRTIWPADLRGDEPRVSNPDGDLHVLEIAWLLQDPRSCGPEPPRSTVTLTRATRLPMEPVEPGPYLVRLETDYPLATGCRDIASWQGVRLTLSERVDADHVILLTGPGPTPAPSVPGSQSIELLTADRPAGDVCRLAGMSGPLTRHAVTGLGVGPSAVRWPFGYSARVDEHGLAVLISPDGRVVAREGDQVSFGGGVGNDGIFTACGV
ncbi:hypothetical protein BH23CHL7_BH23CHL7_15090 [soil metagenome]